MVTIGSVYAKAGQRWVVTDTTAGIITLSAANGKRKDRIIHPSELAEYRIIKKK